MNFLDLTAIRHRLSGKERRSMLEEIRREMFWEKFELILNLWFWFGSGIVLGGILHRIL